MDLEDAVTGKRICVLVGAGMSKAAGIPTFRGNDGVWLTNKRVLQSIEINTFKESSASRRKFWRWFANSPAWRAQPTRAHWLIKQLDDAGHLVSVLTQNFDMLEKKAGIRQGKIRQLHGRMDRSVCLDCGCFFDTRQFCQELSNRPEPRCPECGGIIKPCIVFFGEQLDEIMLRYISGIDIPSCDELWCIGSSLTVYPAADMPKYAKELGKRIVIVSTTPTALDDIADEVIRQPADIAMALLASRTIN